MSSKLFCLRVPFTLAILVGYQIIAFMNATQTLLVDLVPSQGSSITACVCHSPTHSFSSARLIRIMLQNNLVRCSLGAGLIAVINAILDALKPGWTYVLLGSICALMGPLIYLETWLGPRCRAKRRAQNALPSKSSM